MATGIQNEIQYVRYFNMFYGSKNRTALAKQVAGKVPTKVIFKENTISKKDIEINNVTAIRREGQRGQKTDIVVYYLSGTITKKLKISIKDDTSVYWGSDDRYIRQKLGGVVRDKLEQLLIDEPDIFYRVELGGRKTAEIIMKEPIGFYLDDVHKNYTMFGTENTNIKNENNLNNADVVIRGEIKNSDVIMDEKNNTLTFLVKKIYESIDDLSNDEQPMLFVYAAKRATFDDPELNISGFRGVRGSFRSLKNVLQRAKSRLFKLK